MQTKTIKQIIKYGIVGLGNTLLSLLVIGVMMKVFGYSDVVSNIAGYAVGFVNSFIWNKKWTFKSFDTWQGSVVRFTLVFGICFFLQLQLLLYLNAHLVINDTYYNQIIAMLFYTILNFLLNKYFTFKKQKE
ncbi:MAG: GtrA family protein [Tannerellaceae bacterium]|jgi:putative flippase GtrA|nr:GtrA family protein [Tannerellaceae bacterium]